MTSIEKLDEVLKLAVPKNNEPSYPFYASQAISVVKYSENFTESQIAELTSQMPQILDKLVKDGYLARDLDKEAKEKLGPIGKKIYIITFEGQMFVENGGYTRKQKRDSTLATLQSWQTWAIVLGTLMAGIYGLFEILRRIF